MLNKKLLPGLEKKERRWSDGIRRNLFEDIVATNKDLISMPNGIPERGD
jgi:hypothetical protein